MSHLGRGVPLLLCFATLVSSKRMTVPFSPRRCSDDLVYRPFTVGLISTGVCLRAYAVIIAMAGRAADARGFVRDGVLNVAMRVSSTYCRRANSANQQSGLLLYLCTELQH